MPQQWLKLRFDPLQMIFGLTVKMLSHLKMKDRTSMFRCGVLPSARQRVATTSYIISTSMKNCIDVEHIYNIDIFWFYVDN